MNRRSSARIALLVLPLVALLLYAALNWYTIVEEETWVGSSDAAKENPYLAYGRLLERMGVRAVVARTPAALDSLPERGTLVIGDRRLAYMTPDRVRRMRAWVERGGSLVLDVEGEGIDDPLLEAFGVQRVFPERDPRDPKKNAERFAGVGAVLAFDWPWLGMPMKARLGRPVELRDTRVHTQVDELRQGTRLIGTSFPAGEGRFTAMPTIDFLLNGQIGQYDHAQLGWRLASIQSPAVLYLRMTSPPLLEWAQRDAWPVIVAAALLLVLWLARIIPRFGPLEPDAPPNRRSLLEHVVASGRFLWSRGAAAALVEAVRERASRAARRRGLSAQSIGARVPAIATARLDAAAFTSRIASLQKLEEQLARREVPQGFRRKGRT
jgi:hypothetical protein